jgi:hypothetical protein
MSELFYSLAVLACPLGMGAMMWFMMRGKRSGPQPAHLNEAELADMRTEIDRLRSMQGDAHATDRR